MIENGKEFRLKITNYIEKLRNIKVIAWTTILFGILLFVSDKFKLNRTLKKNFSFKAIF